MLKLTDVPGQVGPGMFSRGFCKMYIYVFLRPSQNVTKTFRKIANVRWRIITGQIWDAFRWASPYFPARVNTACGDFATEGDGQD